MMPPTPPKNPTLVTLASRQIWPQVLAVLRLEPLRLVLLHSEDKAESGDPAQRLKRFFDASGLVPKGGTTRQEIPCGDFEGILTRLEGLEVDPQTTLLHFTGGNKLMAIAAFQWASRRKILSFYLERANRMIWFAPSEEGMQIGEEALDGHIADRLDPLQLLRCQVDASELERNGELLRLNERGTKLSLEEISARCDREEDLRPFLSIGEREEGDKKDKEGDRLEYNTAVALLKLGVQSVRRSLRLKVKSSPGVSTNKVHEEIDLLFNFDGRLWLVDCKDRRPAEELVSELEKRLKLASFKIEQVQTLLQRIQDELSIGQLKTLKLDLLSIQDVGGLLGRTICVRRSVLPEEVREYAKKKGIEVIRSTELVNGLRVLLHAKAPATDGDLSDLRERFTRGSQPKLGG
ncbi:hypothetical protein MAMC_01277 [Methylacidimicrobium cyclopophantes]|uniref:Uncharacterized protein n=1 Tax=Methylacidimicrobium cyclopophantes TaxID=1041766 RepID=A0A5E6MC57_9BACT|nr:hypothetical protein [Methylacidimicrobium cyclopophantes]VVM06818.1 hypothetical protein MAMC_01277 [Methylacidimicrobium cyclopophantes]